MRGIDLERDDWPDVRDSDLIDFRYEDLLENLKKNLDDEAKDIFEKMTNKEKEQLLFESKKDNLSLKKIVARIKNKRR